MRRISANTLAIAIANIRNHHPRPPQNGSMSDSYNLLADVCANVLLLGLGDDDLSMRFRMVLETLPDLPEKCPLCKWTPGTNTTCACYHGKQEG